MKRFFTALLALMIFFASLSMSVPARADSYQDGTDVVYEGWYQYMPVNVPDGIDLVNIDFSRVVFEGFLFGYVDSTFYQAFFPDAYISPTGVLVHDLNSIGYDVDTGIFVLNGGVVSPVLGELSTTIPIFYLYLDCRITAGEGNISTDEFAKFMTAFEEISGNPFDDVDGGLADGGIYGSIYDLIGNAFYGSVDNISGYQDLVITVLATLAVVIMFALPFLALWLFLKLIGVL